MAEVLPRVEHLGEDGKSRDRVGLCPAQPASALRGPDWKTSLEKVETRESQAGIPRACSFTPGQRGQAKAPR